MDISSASPGSVTDLREPTMWASGTMVPRTSVERAMALLFAFGGGESIGVTELARRTSMPKSTAHRLLSLLESRGLVARDGVDYALGLSLFELGSRVPIGPHGRLRDAALPFLEDLYGRTQGTVHLAVLAGAEVLYIEKLCGHDPVSSPSRVGLRLPGYCSAVGKALIAHSPRSVVEAVLRRGLEPRTRYTIVRPPVFLRELDAIRGTGTALDREEMELGLECVAAPVLNDRGRAVAAISVSGRPGHVESWAPVVRRVAAGVPACLPSVVSR